MGEPIGGADATVATPSARRNTVSSVGELIGGVGTTGGFGYTVDKDVMILNMGDVIQVNLIHTFDYKIHNSYLI